MIRAWQGWVTVRPAPSAPATPSRGAAAQPSRAAAAAQTTPGGTPYWAHRLERRLAIVQERFRVSGETGGIPAEVLEEWAQQDVCYSPLRFRCVFAMFSISY